MNDQVFWFFGFLILIVILCSTSQSSVEYFPEEAAGTSCERENRNLKMLSKYLTLILRKRDAEKELYRLEQGHARVYNSPRLNLLDKQIYSLKKEIQKHPNMLSFFKLNLDLIV